MGAMKTKTATGLSRWRRRLRGRAWRLSPQSRRMSATAQTQQRPDKSRALGRSASKKFTLASMEVNRGRHFVG